MSVHTLRIRAGDNVSSISAQSGDSLLTALRNSGFSAPAAPCGGNGTCKRCLVRVTGPLLPVGAGEAYTARGDELLACRWRPAGDCGVTLPVEGVLPALISGVGDIAPFGSGLGVAVDIGTTTVAVILYDLETGCILASRGGRNAQRTFGADVISRIQHSAEPGGLDMLSGLIRNQLGAYIDSVCHEAGRSASEIGRVSVAGNTVMEHIFEGLSPVGIGVAPFTPLSLFGDERPSDWLIPGLSPSASLYLCPALAGYVGGDITAGLYSSGAARSEGLCLFLDIGTNGEMGLGDRNGFTCCATAAGPAFEGAEIDCGMDGSDGAVDKVRLCDGKLDIHVVGGGEAKGICGSGLIDALAVMLQLGIITGAGRMLSPEEAPVWLQSRLRRSEDGVMRFYLQGDVYVSARDVRAVQLAKAAIRAGAETLLALLQVGYNDVDSLIIAGGFGAYMDVDSALGIGLLPPLPRGKIRHVGNAAGAGAALSLNPGLRLELDAFSAKCSYHELSSSKIFMEKYLECMAFEETEEEV